MFLSHVLAVMVKSILTPKICLDMPHTKGKFRAPKIIGVDDLNFVLGQVPDRDEHVLIKRVAMMCWKCMTIQENP
jgi:hypothetical protein